MKRFLGIILLAAFFAGTAFAQSSDKALRSELANADSPDMNTRIIKIDGDYSFYHPGTSFVDIELEYTPLTDEVVFTYTCMAASFDQGEAMDTAYAVLLDFQKQNQYTRYTYRTKDKVKYFKDSRGIKMATYRSVVIFTR